MSGSIRKAGWVVAAVLLLGGAAGYAWLRHAKGTVKVSITRPMIDGALARKFPKEKTYLKIIRVAYVNPEVVFLPQEDKVRVGLDVRVELGIKGLSKSYQGSAAITTRVGYDPTAYRFFLHQAQVESLTIPKLSVRDLELVKEGLNLVASEWIDRIPIYQLSERDTGQRFAKLVLKEIEIKGDRAVATLGL